MKKKRKDADWEQSVIDRYDATSMRDLLKSWLERDSSVTEIAKRLDISWVGTRSLLKRHNLWELSNTKRQTHKKHKGSIVVEQRKSGVVSLSNVPVLRYPLPFVPKDISFAKASSIVGVILTPNCIALTKRFETIPSSVIESDMDSTFYSPIRDSVHFFAEKITLKSLQTFFEEVEIDETDQLVLFGRMYFTLLRHPKTRGTINDIDFVPQGIMLNGEVVKLSLDDLDGMVESLFACGECEEGI